MENIPFHQVSRQVVGVNTPEETPALGQAIGNIWRWKARILGLALIGAVLGANVALQTPEKYASTALLLVSPIEQSVLGYNAATTGLSAELFVLDTHIQLLRSPAHLQLVAESLHASRDADKLLRLVKADAGYSEQYATMPEDALRQYIKENLTVRQEGAADLIGVSFLSTDPSIAALVANAVCEEFLSEQISSRSAETDRIRRQLELRVGALEAEARRAAALVHEYRVENGLLLSRETQANELSDLRATLLGAESDLEALDGELAQLRASIAAGRALAEAPEVLGSPRIAELETTDTTDGGPPVDAAIAREIARIEADLELRRNTSAARVDALRVTIAAQRQQLSDRAGAEVDLDILKRNAAEAGDLYSQMLRRLDQVGEEAHFIEPDMRFVSAAIPSRRPVTPGPPLLAAMGFIAFLVLGAVIALFFGPKREAVQ